MDWLNAVAAFLPPPLPWVAASLLIYALTAQLVWLSRAWRGWDSLYGRTARQAGRFAFYVGIPYLALGGWPRPPYRGDLAPADLGLVGLNADWPPSRWLGAAGLGLSLGLAAGAVLALAWRSARRAPGGAALSFAPRPWWEVGVGVLYAQVHWAFYRGALALAWGSPYAGVFGGLVPVLVEWALDPRWRWGWRQAGIAAEQWLRAALLLVTALLFLLTRNGWVCLAVHLLIESAFRLVGDSHSR